MRPSLPRRPRLHSSYYAIDVPESDEVQLHSEGRAVRLQPLNGSPLVRRLLEAMDGERTVDDVVGLLSEFDRDQVLESLQQLWGARLLEEGDTRFPDGSGEQQRLSEQLTFLSHTASDPTAVQNMITTSRIVVIGSGAVSSRLRQSLIDSGVVDLVAVDSSVSGQREAAQAIESASLVVVASDGHDPELLDWTNSRCFESGRTWVPVAVRGWEGHLGPTVVPAQTACYACFDLRTKSNMASLGAYLLYEERLRQEHGARSFGALPQFAQVVANLAAMEVLRVTAGISTARTLGRFISIDFINMTMETHEVLKLPRCRVCGVTSADAPPIRPWSD